MRPKRAHTPYASIRLPRSTRPPKSETPKTVFKRHPKHRRPLDRDDAD